MKILYGIQATGNGHIARAMELVPELMKYADVTLFMSGTESSIHLPYPITFQRHGLSIFFGQKGQLDYLKTAKNIRMFNLLEDVIKCPVEEYDLVVTDFEPITAWSARRKKVPSVSVSHQAAFYSAKTPRPQKSSLLGEAVLKYYAPADRHIGFHFQCYDDHIYGPLLRKEICTMQPVIGSHYVVYLPAYSPHYLVHFLTKIRDVQWKIFSKYVSTPSRVGQVEIFPTSKEHWLESLRTAQGVLMGAGFEGPSEALFLRKKLMVVPMKGQYEQKCNAEALFDLGIPSIAHLGQDSLADLRSWIHSDTQPVQCNPAQSEDIVQQIIHG